MDKLTCMRTFAAVFKTGSFTKAAEYQDISIGLVSKRINYLESTLNIELFNRTTRSIVPTADGEEYFKHCCNVLNEIDIFEHELDVKNDSVKGVVTISAPLALGLVYLQNFVPCFHNKYPNINLQINLNDSLEDFSKNPSDIILRICKDLPDTGLLAKQILEIKRVAVASPEFCKKNRIKKPEDLASTNCLLYRNNKTYDYWDFFKDGQKNSVLVRGNLISNNGQLLKSSAINGLGVMLGPKFVVQDALDSKLITEVLPEYQLESKFLYALYSVRLRKSNNIKIFIDELKDFLIAKD
ncbi:LysR substrate-binding domain-containing protein [Pseudofrancisella aestuarii]|uniref:LysR substrate-binding domain-containing protein n=1 Tax=Pseudofrancisella aestuarii TaxID=2670347 RepID=A0ABV9TDF9_9GAMM|nr:LysR family transcriptional regulator [Pseudofrancisella aestuarii]